MEPRVHPRQNETKKLRSIKPGGFGGTATQGLVPIWHTLYSSDGKTKIIGGLTDEIERELVRRRQRARQRPPRRKGASCRIAL